MKKFSRVINIDSAELFTKLMVKKIQYCLCGWFADTLLVFFPVLCRRSAVLGFEFAVKLGGAAKVGLLGDLCRRVWSFQKHFFSGLQPHLYYVLQRGNSHVPLPRPVKGGAAHIAAAGESFYTYIFAAMLFHP